MERVQEGLHPKQRADLQHHLSASSEDSRRAASMSFARFRACGTLDVFRTRSSRPPQSRGAYQKRSRQLIPGRARATGDYGLADGFASCSLSCAWRSTASLAPKSSSSNTWRTSISPSWKGTRRAHSSASSLDFA